MCVHLTTCKGMKLPIAVGWVDAQFAIAKPCPAIALGIAII